MRRAALTLTAGLVVALGIPAAAPGSVSHQLSTTGGDKRPTLEFWTSKRLRNAEPRELSAPSPDAARPASPQVSAAGDPPGSVPPSEATVGRAAILPHAGAQPASSPGLAYEVVDPDRPPNTVHGKVFGRDRAGTFECSATAVTSANRSVVFTAGHCVRLFPFGWARKLVFIPSYAHGRQPYGAWAAEVLWAPGPWVRHQHQNFDMAAVVLASQAGVPVQDAVGGAGFAWNQSREQTYGSFGYPANFFAAQRMMGCRSGARHRTIDFGKGPAMVAMSCDMGSGSSGGGWLIGDGLLNSVQSLSGNRNLAAGPYFGKAARRLLIKAQAE